MRTQRSGFLIRRLLPALMFLVGIAVGVAAVLLFILLVSGNTSPLPAATPAASPTPGQVSVQADAATVAPLLEQSAQAAEIPGTITNVQVQFAVGAQMTITGNYEYIVLNAQVSNPFTIQFQLLANDCQLQIHVLHVDFARVPVTRLVALFEDKINQKLQPASNTIAGKVTYCLTAVHTDSAELSATFSLVFLTPTPSADVSPSGHRTWIPASDLSLKTPR